MGIAADYRANLDRPNKAHITDRHGRGAAASDAIGNYARGRVHLGYQPATGDIATDVGIGAIGQNTQLQFAARFGV